MDTIRPSPAWLTVGSLEDIYVMVSLFWFTFVNENKTCWQTMFNQKLKKESEHVPDLPQSQITEQHMVQ